MERSLSSSLFAAFLLWFAMFSPWVNTGVNFWGLMLSAAVLLSALSLWNGRVLWQARWQRFRAMPLAQGLKYALSQLLLGLAIAAILWGVFYVGDKLSQWLFPSFARVQVNQIYAIKGSWSPQLLAWLLLLLVGPAEEIFWRGYVQATFCRVFADSDNPKIAQWSSLVAFVVATLVYCFIHVPSLNFMLIMAALVCGVVWGGVYYLRPQWLPAIVVSHAFWDAAVFIWLPI